MRRPRLRRPSLPYVPQLETADCGAACLATVLRFHGRDVSLAELRIDTGTGRDGVSAKRLLEAARRHGLTGRGVKIGYHDLAKLPRGSILHWRFSHFVVLDRVVRGGILVIDPAFGRVMVPAEEVDAALTGVALVLRPGADFDRARARRRLHPSVVRSLRQPRSWANLISLSVALRAAALLPPVVAGAVVDGLTSRGSDVVVDAALIATLVGVVGFAAVVARGLSLSTLRNEAYSRLTSDLVAHLARLPYGFFERRAVGDLLARLNSTAVIRDILSVGLMSAVLDGVFATAYLAYLAVHSIAITAGAVGLALLQVSFMLLVAPRYRLAVAATLEANARSQSQLVEMFRGMETLKSLGSEARAANQWENVFAGEVAANLRTNRLASLLGAAPEAVRLIAPVALIAIGAVEVARGGMSVGALVAAAAVGQAFLQPVGNLVSASTSAFMLRSYLARLDELFETATDQPPGAPVPTAGPATITGRALTFSYPGSATEVVRGVDLDIAPGSFVGIVGQSGSGKSSLLRLLAGLYEPTGGTVLYGEEDLVSIDRQLLRRRIGFLPQQAYVFAGSIQSNVTLWDDDITAPEVEEAIRLADLDDFVAALPMGLDTFVSDGGSSLSGGERQRLAIARVIVRRPDVLLLDEPTSQLDSRTEERVMGRLAALDATRIVVAHRLATVAGADEIVVMAGGRVVERGSHHDLLAARGEYWQLHTLQNGPQADEIEKEPVALSQWRTMLISRLRHLLARAGEGR